MKCPYCPITDPDQKIIFENDLVRFLQNERYQGALKHSGIIIPVQHQETVFDLSEAEITATFRLLSAVKKWMDDHFATEWIQHRLELWHHWRSRGLSRSHACDSEISTGAASWQRYQDASKIRRK